MRTLYCNLTLQSNVNIEKVSQNTLSWLVDFNLITKGSKIYNSLKDKDVFTLFAAYTNPTISESDFQIFSDWLTWLFIYDDLCDRSEYTNNPDQLKIFQQELIQASKELNEYKTDNNFCKALINILTRVFKEKNTEAHYIFVKDLESYFNVNIWEINNNLNQISPSLQEYIQKRPIAGAVDCCLNLSCIIHDVPFYHHLPGNSTFKRLIASASNHLCWANDVFSLHKEIVEKNNQNIVLILANTKNISIETALADVIDWTNKELEKFLELKDKLLSENITENEILYIDILTNWISGNYFWCLKTNRYKQYNQVAQVNEVAL